MGVTEWLKARVRVRGKGGRDGEGGREVEGSGERKGKGEGKGKGEDEGGREGKGGGTLLPALYISCSRPPPPSTRLPRAIRNTTHTQHTTQNTQH